MKRRIYTKEHNPNWRGGKEIECPICGKLFWLRPSYWDDRKTCSIKCRNELWRINRTFAKENNPHWNGESNKPYGKEFDNSLKQKIRERDGLRCQECFRHQNELYDRAGRKYKLIVHHIDFNKQNNKESNLISLCRNCHLQVGYGQKDWTKYYQDKLLVA